MTVINTPYRIHAHEEKPLPKRGRFIYVPGTKRPGSIIKDGNGSEYVVRRDYSLGRLWA